LKQGRYEFTTSLTRKLYSIAMSNDNRTASTACMFLLKCKAGFRETGEGVAVNVATQQQTVLKIPSQIMTPEEWNEIAARHQAMVLEQPLTVGGPINTARPVPPQPLVDDGPQPYDESAADCVALGSGQFIAPNPLKKRRRQMRSPRMEFIPSASSQGR
jgi:hypothetical protein